MGMTSTSGPPFPLGVGLPPSHNQILPFDHKHIRTLAVKCARKCGINFWCSVAETKAVARNQGRSCGGYTSPWWWCLSGFSAPVTVAPSTLTHRIRGIVVGPFRKYPL
jgi:hypothetical protein